MIPLRLSEVAAACGGLVDPGDADVVVATLTTDSRAVSRQALFVALKGRRHDGHDHVAQAVERGAAGYLAEREVRGGRGAVLVPDTRHALADLARHVRRRVDPTVVALTGSVGKTTTKDLTAAAVGAGRRTVAAPGSFNNELGVPLTCLALREDTEVLVVEVGARGIGHISALMPLVAPDVAIVTAVASAHLETFRDLESVARAKSELVEALEPGGTAVLNADDPRVAAMAARTRARVLTFGRRHGVAQAGGTRPVDLLAEQIRLDRLARPRFIARTPWGDVEVWLPLAGEHHVPNALAALATAGLVGVDLPAAAASLRQARISTWRSDVREAGGVVVLNDAYNANPASMQAALRTLVTIGRGLSGASPVDRSPPTLSLGDAPTAPGVPPQRGGGRTWAVLGTMAELGDTSVEEHERLGRYCVRLNVDRLIVVGEDAWPIAKGADLEGFFGAGMWHVTDAAAALDLLRMQIAPGDVVLVKASRVAGLERVAAGLLESLSDDGTTDAAPDAAIQARPDAVTDAGGAGGKAS